MNRRHGGQVGVKWGGVRARLLLDPDEDWMGIHETCARNLLKMILCCSRVRDRELRQTNRVRLTSARAVRGAAGTGERGPPEEVAVLSIGALSAQVSPCAQTETCQ